jgi:hypothetical protein
MQLQCSKHAKRESIPNPLLFHCHWFLPLPAFVLPGPMPGYAQRPAHVRGGTGGRSLVGPYLGNTNQPLT